MEIETKHKDAIDELFTAAKNSTAMEALHYSQAALNIANAVSTLKHTEKLRNIVDDDTPF